MSNNEKFLPIGTVVRLVNGTKAVMIIGFCPVGGTGESMYDYCACLYPEGVVTSEFNLMFNHEQVEEVLSLGFVNDEEKTFKTKLNTILAQKQANGELPPKAEVTSRNTQKPVQSQISAQNVAQPQMFTINPNQQ